MPTDGRDAAAGDVGEKIGGARKDVWSGFREKVGSDLSEDEILRLPLSKSFPEPDYARLSEQGADPLALAIIKTHRDEIPRKSPSKHRRAQYLNGVKVMRNMARKLLDNPEYASRWMEEARKRNDPGLNRAADRVELMLELGFPNSGVDLKGITLEKRRYAVWNGKKNVEKWVVDDTARSRRSPGGMGGLIAETDTREEAVAALREHLSRRGAAPGKARQTRFEVYKYRSPGKAKGWVIGKKMGRNYLDLQEGFSSSREAREYLEANRDALESRLAQYKTIPAHRRPENEPRVGENHRGGNDISAEEFREAFGFRGVEFGNWVEQGRRQQDVNDAYDGLMDLSAIVGVPPKALSLNGELGLAFGARGGRKTSGGVAAAAHYEPDHVAINLTKTKGAGSLAHEWFHAMDNYFSRMRGEGESYVTERPYPYTRIEGGRNVPDARVRVEMLEAFNRIMQAVKRSGLPRRAATLDARRSKQYWSSDVEMAARAFESYVVNKLKSQGYSNDYLANIVSPEYWDAAESLGLEAGNSYPYLLDDEMEAVNEAFDAFFKTVRTRETDNGVAMFARKPESRHPGLHGADNDSSIQDAGADSIVLNGDELGEFRSLVDFKIKVRAWAKENLVGEIVHNQNDGTDIEINWQGIKHDTGGQVTKEKLQTIVALPEMLSEARHVRSESDRSGRVTIKAVHVYETPVILEGERYDVYLYVREHADGRRFYGHYVARKAKPAGISGDSTQATSERRSVQPAAGSDENIDEGKRANKVYATDKPGDRMTTDKVNAAIRRVKSTWGANAPGINVVQSIEELPDALRDQIPDDGRRTQGVHDPDSGGVYLVAGGLANRKEALSILAHEAVGHYGMEEMLGEQYDLVLKKVMRQLARGDRRIRALADEVRENHGELDADAQAREIVALMAERRQFGSWLGNQARRIYAGVREFLRRLGFNVAFSTPEIEALLADAGKYLRESGKKSDRGSSAGANFARKRGDSAGIVREGV